MREILLWAMMLGTGCHLVGGIEEAELDPTGSGGSGAGAGGAAGAGAGAGGTGGESCSGDSSCDDGDVCTEDTCTNGKCGYKLLEGLPAPDDGKQCTEDKCTAMGALHTPKPTETPCNESSGVCNPAQMACYCDGKGECVECTANKHCTAPEICGVGGVCACMPVPCSMVGLSCGFAPDDGCGKPLDCNNDMKDGGETDVDCGGPPMSCSIRCKAGKICVVDTDCEPPLKCPMGTCIM